MPALPDPTIDEVLAPKPEARLRIYAWSFNNPPPDYSGLIKVGQTLQADVNTRIRQSPSGSSTWRSSAVRVVAPLSIISTRRDMSPTASAGLTAERYDSGAASPTRASNWPSARAT